MHPLAGGETFRKSHFSICCLCSVDGAHRVTLPMFWGCAHKLSRAAACEKTKADSCPVKSRNHKVAELGKEALLDYNSQDISGSRATEYTGCGGRCWSCNLWLGSHWLSHFEADPSNQWDLCEFLLTIKQWVQYSSWGAKSSWI